jgi:predicted TIM-barrel fold metal-dependent hydrolase
MLIVDAQVHIWGANTVDRPWPARHQAHREIALGHTELLTLMDEAGVNAAIIIPPSWEGERNDLVLAAAKAHPKRFAIMGRIDPEASASRDLLATWRQEPGMLGLRFSLHRPGLAEAISNGAMDWLWEQAQKHGVPLMLLLPHSKLQHIAKIAARYPELRLVIDHMGIPSSVPSDQRFKDFSELLALAKHPNLAVKISALPCFASDKYPFASLHPYLKKVFDSFGPTRMFWGSDFTRLPCSYRQSVTMLTEEISWLNEEDKSWIMGKSLCQWLGWDLGN